MPFYEVQHTYPLNPTQQHALARSITHLHSTTFLTPSLFVNVVFRNLSSPSPPGAETTYFLAGEPTTRHPAGPNRILGMVRVGSQRTKPVFDELAAKLEAAWYAAVNSATDSTQDARLVESKEDREAKKMHLVVFYPMVAARENGVTIPDAGSESTWLKDNMPYFKSQAYDHEDEDFRHMIEEIDQRADLRKLLD